MPVHMLPDGTTTDRSIDDEVWRVAKIAAILTSGINQAGQSADLMKMVEAARMLLAEAEKQVTAAQPETVDVPGIGAVPKLNVINAIKRFHAGQGWHFPFGPEPGHPGCWIAQSLIEEARKP